MKKILIVFSLFAIVTAVRAQTSTNVTMGQEFAGLVKVGGGGTAAFQTYSSNQIDGSQFFFPGWENGDVVTNNNSAFGQGLVFIYDKVRQELFIKKQDSSAILLGNKDDIKSFSLNDNGKPYRFINSSQFGIVNPEVFYQILVDNPSNDSSKLTLLKYTSAKLVKANMADMSRQREGIVNDAFVDSYSYYVIKGTGTIQEIPLKTKAVKKVLSDLHFNADQYIKEHTGGMNEEYLVTMISDLNR